MTADDGVLLRPENYYRVPNSEDRLFVSPEHVPLFVERGWKREAAGRVAGTAWFMGVVDCCVARAGALARRFPAAAVC